MKDVLGAFKIILDKNKKPSQRGKSIKLIGIKSLECNFNPVTRTYNPHLHLIVPNKETADFIVSAWLKLFTKKFSVAAAQDSQPVKNLESALVEVIKYSSKIFTEPDPNRKKEGKKATPYVYVSALDNIIWAMKGLRVFERFGFNSPKTNTKKVNTSTVLYDYKEWNYDPSKCNWIDTEWEQRLSEYTPAPQLLALLESNFNMVLD